MIRLPPKYNENKPRRAGEGRVVSFVFFFEGLGMHWTRIK